MDVLYDFVTTGSYDIYASDGERNALKGIPTIWKNKKFIKYNLVMEHGFCFPLIYDIAGLHRLYGIDPETDEKIDAVINYISTDAFHRAVDDGYGILISDNNKYHAMGWDPKYPGWFGVNEYIENGNVPKLLFFAQNIARYPAARKTRWFAELLDCLYRYKTADGTYIFPAAWLKERQGYAVLGHHISFGEDRRRKNWREIESTFYMQLLLQDFD